MIAFDAKTGAISWRQGEVNKTVASFIAGRIAGVDVVISQQGEIVRASDGHVLWRNKGKTTADTGWAAPLLVGSTLYIPWGGVGSIIVVDCSEVEGEDWRPKLGRLGDIAISRGPDGKWLDKWTPASWLLHDGVFYNVDIYGTLYAVDAKSGKVLYRQELDFRPHYTYVDVGIAASPTLGGKNIYVWDNQGNTVVFEPGPQFKLVARNRLGTVIERIWPVPAQETVSIGPPVFEGRRIYVRGERHLYCIGAQ
jgi:outer membrane protein assembly factor BamB